MAEFKVWAPERDSMDLQIGDHSFVMKREGEWFVFNDPGYGAGTDYFFVVDGDRIPDPRSAHQPAGVHGPSRTVDHRAFPWSDGEWQGLDLSDAVLYELHIGTFTPEGTFDAAIGKLHHFVELGVGAIEIMPVAEFSGTRGWGYDGVDLFAPHHAYGGPDGLKRLVDACHSSGLGVILDVVYNHLGPSGNHLSRFAPYFTDRYGTPWGQAINLDGRYSQGVREFLIDNALMWLRDYHFDGLRIDAVHAMFDQSATHFLEELQISVEELRSELHRNLFLVAESDLNDPRLVWPRDRGGFGLQAQWSDDFHHALHCVLTGESSGYYEDFGSVTDLAAAVTEAYVYSGRYSVFRKRHHGRKIEINDGGRFVVYLQNHDQIGNRASGARSSHLMSPSRLKIGAALVLTSPFVPMLFQGEEWGATTPFLYFTAHDDPELGEAVSRGRREEFAAFGWDPEQIPDPQAIETFDRSKLDWEELHRGAHSELLEWHRSLIELRRKTPDLASHDLKQTRTFHGESGWIVIQRGKTVIVANLSDQVSELDIGTASSVILASGHVQVDATTIVLAPECLGILAVEGNVEVSHKERSEVFGRLHGGQKDR